MLAAPGGEVDVPDGEAARGVPSWSTTRPKSLGSGPKSATRKSSAVERDLVQRPLELGELAHHRVELVDLVGADGPDDSGGHGSGSSVGLATFQRWSVRLPCSCPSTHTAAVANGSAAPSDTGRPSQRAASERSRWPCETSTASAAPSRFAAATRSRTRSQRWATSSVGLAAGARVGEHRPAGDLLTDLRRRQPLVGAVVPLHEVRVEPERRQPGQLGSADGPHQRADQHRAAAPGPLAHPADRPGERACLALAVGVQRHVGAARVPAGPRPLGAAVPDEDDSRPAHAAQDAGGKKLGGDVGDLVVGTSVRRRRRVPGRARRPKKAGSTGCYPKSPSRGLASPPRRTCPAFNKKKFFFFFFYFRPEGLRGQCSFREGGSKSRVGKTEGLH